jgi:hypothetical protein
MVSKSFILKHWCLTIILTPLAIFFINFSTSNFNLEYLELYFLFLFFGTFLSIPTLLICFSLLQILNSRQLNKHISKAVLIFTPAIAAYLTLLIIGGTGTWSEPLAYSYSTVAIITGIGLLIFAE